MLLSKRFWTLAFLATGAILLPRTGFCYETEEPYEYRPLLFNVTFEYEKDTTQDQSSNKHETNTFRQIYRFDTLGNFFSPRVMVYDAGLEIINSDTNSTPGETSSNSITKNYFFRTTILPKSLVPLTLYWNNSTGESSSNTSSTINNESTIYGLRWNIRVEPLPITSFTVEKTKTQSDTSELDTTTYLVHMSKRLGPSLNLFDYRSSSSQGGGSETNSTALNFQNNTRVTRSTTTDFGFSKGDSNSAGTSTSSETSGSNLGISMGVSSAPSRYFTQDHRYSYYNTESTTSTGKDESTGNNYSGNLLYQFSETANAATNLVINDTENKSPTLNEKSRSVGTSIVLNYIINKNLTLNESVGYSSFESTTNDLLAGTTNLSDQRSLTITTGLTYTKPLSWATLASNYSLGYDKEEASGGAGGTGITQQAALALNNIDVSKYVVMNTSTAWSNVQSTSGDIDSSSWDFDFNASNKLWLKYARMQGSYHKRNYSSFIAAQNSDESRIHFSADSSYFNKTSLTASYDRASRFNELEGDSETDTTIFTVTRNEAVWKGVLNLGFTYNKVDETYTGGATSYDTRTYFARYNRRFLQSITWYAAAYRAESSGSNLNRTVTTISNLLSMPVKAWFVSLEHQYTNTLEGSADTVENRFFLRASRNFIRFLT